MIFGILFQTVKSFIAKILKSFGQMASKLPVVKVGGLMKKSAIWPRPHSNQSARVQVVPGSNHSQSLMAGNFAALWPKDSKFSELKDLNPFKTVSKVQEASSILRMGFALSKYPHFNSTYLVRVPFVTRTHCQIRLSVVPGHYCKLLHYPQGTHGYVGLGMWPQSPDLGVWCSFINF